MGLRLSIAEYEKALKRQGKELPSDIKKSKGKSKYGNKRAEADGIVFHSKAERDRYLELKFLERMGVIAELDLQPKFKLMDSFKYKGKTYQAMHYIADFRYKEVETGIWIVEDVKGVRTSEYNNKMKLFLNQYGDEYDFREINV